MKSLDLECGNCRRELELDLEEPVTHLRCPVCSASIEIHAFPTLLHARPQIVAPERVLIPGESSCFYHAQNKAANACDHCGKFLCALCEIYDDNKPYCPECFALQRSAQPGEGPQVLLRHDDVAISVAVVSLLIWPLSIFTAPYVLYTVIRHWNKPCGFFRPYRKLNFVVAGLLALLQLGGWAIGVGSILLSANWE